MRDCLSEAIRVGRSGYNGNLVDTQLVNYGNRVHVIDVNPSRGTIDVDDLLLAVDGVNAGLDIILEETVESSTIN